MATLPSSQECANSILEIFKDHATPAGGALEKNQIEAEFLASGRPAADCAAGLMSAIERHLIQVERDRVRLTISGFATMHGDADVASSGARL